MASTHDENSNTSMIESEYAENVSEYASDFPTAEDVKKRQRELNIQTFLYWLAASITAVPAAACFYYNLSFYGGIFFALLTVSLAVYCVVVYAKDPRDIRPKPTALTYPGAPGISPTAALVCPRCGGQNINIQAVTDVRTKHRGCFGWVLWILLALCTLGLIIIIPLLTNSKTTSRTHSEAVCQNCGNRWVLR